MKKQKKLFYSINITWLPLLHYYTYLTGFLAYAFIFTSKLKYSKTDLFFLYCLVILISLQFAMKELSIVILVTRFFWGWVIFYIIFKTYFINDDFIVNTLVLLSFITLSEALLVNTFIDARILPNYPIAEANAHFAHAGFYQRPYSFGANATVSASILVTLLAVVKLQGWRFWLSVSAILSCISGTGTIALVFVLIVKYKYYILKILAPLLLLILTVNIFLNALFTSIVTKFLNKISFEYIYYLLTYKFSSIVTQYERMDISMLLFGVDNINSNSYGGDFGILSFFVLNGFAGFLLFFYLIFSRVNRKNRIPLFILISTSLHYPVMFYLPGQMVLGLLLSINKNGVPNITKTRYFKKK